jgi:hypothetical protein
MIEKRMISRLTNEQRLKMPVTKQVRDMAINDLIDEGYISICKDKVNETVLVYKKVTVTECNFNVTDQKKLQNLNPTL